MKVIWIIGLILNIAGAIFGLMAGLMLGLYISIPGFEPFITLSSAVLLIAIGSICLSFGYKD